jgi:hypothetical protein
MLAGLRNVLQKNWFWFVFISVLSLSVLLFFYRPSSPDGVYFDENMACEHGCWIFEKGDVSAQCDKGTPEKAGEYRKSGSQWFWGNNPTNRVTIKASIFGIQVTGSQFQSGQVFWPRDYFSWIINCKDWIKLHL